MEDNQEEQSEIKQQILKLLEDSSLAPCKVKAEKLIPEHRVASVKVQEAWLARPLNVGEEIARSYLATPEDVRSVSRGQEIRRQGESIHKIAATFLEMVEKDMKYMGMQTQAEDQNQGDETIPGTSTKMRQLVDKGKVSVDAL
ncbi:hypothetical protein H2200_010916 [Cladophialophora chaetospira]|uniref:Uncharacterized protein n=1 Tax=Cladophialophora chaetospira TaxID=386627 RepID=A0AA38X0Z3_9EURO|nr:hypothetical protein H2200_010916 [Cladophialophora chaetospira]